MTLIEFLLARVAEDERAARAATVEFGPNYPRFSLRPEGLLIVTPAAVLAECEAKRRILEIHGPDAEWCGYSHGGDGTHGDMGYGPEPLPMDCDTLKALALPYVDHPDYQEAWRP